ncbi:MAG TPA: hypothetical protein PLR99_27075 [Polyangiaceae bacterium]|nr:hypothetical protein [Polyangiaceae bacterium]
MSAAGFSIHRGAPSSREQLWPLSSRLELGRYCADEALPRAGARALEADALWNVLGDASAVFFATRGDAVVGAVAARTSEWDTRFWGVPYVSLDALRAIGDHDDRGRICEALLGALDEWLRDGGVRFVVARVASLDLPAVHALERGGYRYIETTEANGVDLRVRRYALPEPYRTRPARPDELGSLSRMTEGAFTSHRFYADGGFPTAKVDAMYVAWVESSLASPNWTTFVLEHDGAPKGLGIYRVEDHTGSLGVKIAKLRMLTLGPRDRGRGHGLPLFWGAVEHARGACDLVDSTLTLRNLPSVNIHRKVGFRALAFTSTYHRWL